MTVYPSAKRDKASCEKWWCRWSDDGRSEKEVTASAEEHCRRTGHSVYEINGYRMRFEGEK